MRDMLTPRESYSKKLYFLTFLLVGTFFVSYASLAYYPIPELKQNSEVRGESSSNPFSFLPTPVSAREISLAYTRDGINKAYLLNGKCDATILDYYSRVLEENGWKKDFQRVFKDIGIMDTYSKGKLFLEVSSLLDYDYLGKESCWINLVGGSY